MGKRPVNLRKQARGPRTAPWSWQRRQGGEAGRRSMVVHMARRASSPILEEERACEWRGARRVRSPLHIEGVRAAGMTAAYERTRRRCLEEAAPRAGRSALPGGRSGASCARGAPAGAARRRQRAGPRAVFAAGRSMPRSGQRKWRPSERERRPKRARRVGVGLRFVTSGSRALRVSRAGS